MDLLLFSSTFSIIPIVMFSMFSIIFVTVFIIMLITTIKRSSKISNGIEEVGNAIFTTVKNNLKNKSKIIECEYCGSRFENENNKCPNCGAPNKK